MVALIALSVLYANDSFAWDSNASVRGWVDTITFYTPGFGPQTPGNTLLRGWACVRPDLDSGQQPSTSIYVYQGGPPGQGGVYLPTRMVGTDYRPDTVSYGACNNYDSGFSIWVDSISTIPATFYVYYSGPFGSTVLEGQHTL